MKIGFIGCGNMGEAMLAGILEAGEVRPEDICASCRTASTRERLQLKYGINTTPDNIRCAEFADIIFLAVKPQFYEEVIGQINIYGSAIDHFRIGDVEMAMAQLEMLLDCDPEDHFEAINLLALCYVAMDEWEAFDDIVIDLSDKSAEAVVARLWASHRRGDMDGALLSLLKSRHKAYYSELIAVEHPDDEQFRRDIASDRPSQAAEAREWWLLTEPLWREFSEFIEALK